MGVPPQQDANTKKCVVLPFAKSKMIKLCNWKTVVANSRSDLNFSKKGKDTKPTTFSRAFFQPSWSSIRSKVPPSLTLYVSLLLDSLTSVVSYKCTSCILYVKCLQYVSYYYFLLFIDAYDILRIIQNGDGVNIKTPLLHFVLYLIVRSNKHLNNMVPLCLLFCHLQVKLCNAKRRTLN